MKTKIVTQSIILFACIFGIIAGIALMGNYYFANSVMPYSYGGDFYTDTSSALSDIADNISNIGDFLSDAATSIGLMMICFFFIIGVKSFENLIENICLVKKQRADKISKEAKKLYELYKQQETNNVNNIQEELE